MYQSRPLAVLLALTLTASLSACQSDEPAEQEAPAEESIRLTFAFQPQENPEGLALDTARFAEFIAQETGFEARVFQPTNYSSVVEALRSRNADVAYFSGLPYLLATEMADVELLVVEERDGNPFYYSQWFVLDDSDIHSLEDLRGKSVAFTSPTSTSGFLFPLARVIEDELLPRGGDPNDFFGNVLFAGGYEQALLALAHGRVDAAAASDYALSQYLNEEQQARVRILTRQGPVPTHGLAIRSDLPDHVKDAVREALLKLNEEENVELLRSVYGARRLVAREHDEHVEALGRARHLVDLDSSL